MPEGQTFRVRRRSFYSDQDEFTEVEKMKKIYQQIPDPKMIYKIDSEHDYRLHAEIIDEVNQVVGKFIGTSTKLP